MIRSDMSVFSVAAIRKRLRLPTPDHNNIPLLVLTAEQLMSELKIEPPVFRRRLELGEIPQPMDRTGLEEVWPEPVWYRYAVWPHQRPPNIPAVYFFQIGNGPIKIGKSIDPSKRFRSIQTSCPGKLEFRALLDGGDRAETGLHRLFKRHRLHGEWFSPAPEILFLIGDIRREWDAWEAEEAADGAEPEFGA